MSIVVECSVPLEKFALGHALGAVPEVCVEVERLASHSRGWVMPFLLASGDDLDAFEAALVDDETVAEAVLVDRGDGTARYLVEWSEPVTDLVDAMLNEHAIVQEALADDEWLLKLRFAEAEHLSTFREAVGSDFELHRKYRTADPRHGEFGLTPEQREALVAAAELGYFSVPREATVEDLADRLGISTNSVSQRLRRGHDTLVRNTLLVQGEHCFE